MQIAAAVDEVRHRRRGVTIPTARRSSTHPRAYGTYPRILGRFVREQQVLTLEDAVRKMTGAVGGAACRSATAASCARGCYADVVIFDPNTIIDRATYEQPHQLSVGVRLRAGEWRAGRRRREGDGREAGDDRARAGVGGSVSDRVTGRIYFPNGASCCSTIFLSPTTISCMRSGTRNVAAALRTCSGVTARMRRT